MESYDDIVREILLRLPSKSIFKFTCVSRRWNNVIMDPCFPRLYFERTRRSLASSCPGGRLLGLMQCNTKDGYVISHPGDVNHHFLLPESERPYVGKNFNAFSLFPYKHTYFITSSNDGLFLNGNMPREYYIGNPITGEWDPLPPPPPPQFYPRKAISVGLASDKENGVINFRVVIATGCDAQREITGAKVIPIETYSSRTREWRRSILVSEIPVAIQNYVPPTVSGGFFHWFTASKRYIVAYDSSSLDEEDRRLVKNGEKKKHVVEVIEVPNSRGCSQIIWRSDNGQTMWFGSSNTRDGFKVYRRRDNTDGWALINKVECSSQVRNEIFGITEEDIKNETNYNGDRKTRFSEMVWMIGLTAWDPRVIIVWIFGRLFIYDCIKQKTDCQIEFQYGSNPFSRDGKWQWHPCFFHSLSVSTSTNKLRSPILFTQ